MASPQQISMSGTLTFTYNGRKVVAQAAMTATLLSNTRWTCRLTATAAGFPRGSATFTVSAGATQGEEIKQGIKLAVENWPRPWCDVKGTLSIDLTLDS